VPRPKKWDLTKGKLAVNTAPIAGFSDGDTITATYDTNRHSKHMGADGNGRLQANPAKDGHVTIRLMDYSPANAALQLVVDADEPVLINYVDFTAVGSFFKGDDCVIEKEPDFVRGAESSTNEWVFIFTRGTIKHGAPVLEDI